jgi:hypothetical protein
VSVWGGGSVVKAVKYVGEIMAGAVCARASLFGRRPQSIAVKERAF